LEAAEGEHIWRAEQVGELVSQHFSQRREYTRKLIEEVQVRLNEFTGQIHIEDFLIQNLFEKARPFESSPHKKEDSDDELKTSSHEVGDFGEFTSPTKEDISPSLTPSLSPSGRSALIPIQMPLLPLKPLPHKEVETPSPTSPPEKNKLSGSALLLRFLDSRLLTLVSASLLLGVVLAVLLFWIFTGFGPPR
jgi:hypothetical protein